MLPPTTLLDQEEAHGLDRPGTGSVGAGADHPGFAGTVVATESNEFCISCHELDYAYTGWEQSTHVNNPEGVVANCVDCHVPPQLLDLTFSKVDSLNELYSHWFKPSSDPFWWQENLPRLRARAHER